VLNLFNIDAIFVFTNVEVAAFQINAQTITFHTLETISSHLKGQTCCQNTHHIVHQAKGLNNSLTVSALSFFAIFILNHLATAVSLFNNLILLAQFASAVSSINFLIACLILFNHCAFIQAVGSHVFVNKLYISSINLLA